MESLERKLNIQFFAEGEDNKESSQDEAAEDSKNDSEKVDVQAEAQKIADAIVAKKLKGMPSKEELKVFKEWQDSQKTDEEKKQEKDGELLRIQQENETYKQKLLAYENEKKVLNKGVNPAFAEFVAFKVNQSIDESTDFDKALANFLESNPDYAGNEQKQSFKTGFPQGNGKQKLSGVEEEFLKRNPGLKI